jgi:hypothetical protein
MPVGEGDAMAAGTTQATGTKTTQMRWQHRAGAIVEDTYRYCRQSRRRFAGPLWPRRCCWPPWPWWWWRRLQTCISVIALQPAPLIQLTCSRRFAALLLVVGITPGFRGSRLADTPGSTRVIIVVVVALLTPLVPYPDTRIERIRCC